MMIQHRWFKIEQGADGTILSCAEVEAKGVKGGTVRYYSAVDASAACSLAKEWYANYRRVRLECGRRGKEKLKDLGHCPEKSAGCKVVLQLGESACSVCRLAQKNQRQKRQERHAAGDYMDQRLRDPAAIRAGTLRRAKEAKQRAIEACGGGPAAAEYARILRKFDALGPTAFRAWLVSKIPAMQQTQGEWHPPMVEPMAEAAE